MNAMKSKSVLLNGRPVNYVEAGSGPVLLLIHGMAGNIGNWQKVIEPLARHHTVVAPDLPGHGASAPGAGGYSVGAFAAGLRDLLIVLGHERATLVGHSLGGGIAMQFAYQFPEITERLVLVSSGGLGPEVSPVLRVAALPGADLFIATTATASRFAAALARGLSVAGLRPATDIAEVTRGYASLADSDRRAAFLGTLRSAIGIGGQRIHVGDWLYLAEGMPVLIVWGARDPIIPVRHGERAHQAIPGSRLEIFDQVGHLPQLEAPGQFVAVLERFLEQTEPAQFDGRQWREMPGLEWAAPAPALVFAPLLTEVHYSRAALRLISRIAAVLPGVLLGTIAPAIDQRRVITAPALVLGHGIDLIHSFSDARRLAGQLPGAKLIRTRCAGRELGCRFDLGLRRGHDQRSCA
jgi:pimeloyl-ACP methyl ester carboxylesterase